MSYSNHKPASTRQTILPSQHTRSGSALGLGSSNQSALQSRIQEKKVELESLKQLRDLSAGLAGQMQQLQEKLNTLSNGTEAVAAVMGNWNTVLRAVYMASQAIPKPSADGEKETEGDEQALPKTLVRIPIQQAEAAQREQARKEEEQQQSGGD
ncbi:dash complex subunit dad2 like [Lecanosticta acicola]|uniref:DASH complex subunit DAD2 n=1 Tax=Lecanosticta acicola TaxID=111012 RepID=A0AAI8YYP4_9PEZI|nr:dash complex subunit dad2 like [Lecanosticta acicola]